MHFNHTMAYTHFLLTLLCSISLGYEVQNCCGEHQMLDLANNQCSYVKSHFYNWSSTDSSDTVEIAADLPIKCPNGLMTAQVESLNDALLVPGNNRTLNKAEYCVASNYPNSFTVAYCKAQVVEKCCPYGQVIHSSLRKCVFTTRKEQKPVQLRRYDGKSLLLAHNASNGEYYLTYCHLQLSKYPDGIAFDEYGQPTLTESLFKDKDNYSRYFCVDDTDDPVSNFSMIAMVTETSRKNQRYFRVVRKFYPHFCYGSSIFLFLTMLYYCAKPRLRNNLQGYAMICFLFCLMIVQIDIGLAFAISSFTCVCAYIPYHRNFFRYASTAWTTVMGYIAWKKLRSGAPHTSQQHAQAATFGFYSLYVWGISLVLVLVGVIYDQYIPMTTACWWRSQRVKIFMDVPNITLQMINNVFVIPTVMHVWKNYGSGDQPSVDCNGRNHVPKRRKKLKAVFKMFFVMQSTKLAEILFSIRSLFDIESPEYLMGTMCLYTISGPILFVLLVDIRSVINRESVDEFKLNVRSSTIHYLSSISTRFEPNEDLPISNSTHEAIGSISANITSVKYERHKEEDPRCSEQPGGDIEKCQITAALPRK